VRALCLHTRLFHLRVSRWRSGRGISGRRGTSRLTLRRFRLEAPVERTGQCVAGSMAASNSTLRYFDPYGLYTAFSLEFPSLHRVGQTSKQAASWSPPKPRGIEYLSESAAKCPQQRWRLIGYQILSRESSACSSGWGGVADLACFAGQRGKRPTASTLADLNRGPATDETGTETVRGIVNGKRNATVTVAVPLTETASETRNAIKTETGTTTARGTETVTTGPSAVTAVRGTTTATATIDGTVTATARDRERDRDDRREKRPREDPEEGGPDAKRRKEDPVENGSASGRRSEPRSERKDHSKDSDRRKRYDDDIRDHRRRDERPQRQPPPR
jgi:hypothetical protein